MGTMSREIVQKQDPVSALRILDRAPRLAVAFRPAWPHGEPTTEADYLNVMIHIAELDISTAEGIDLMELALAHRDGSDCTKPRSSSIVNTGLVPE